MDIVSNFVGSISPAMCGKNLQITPNIDMEDFTFSDILEKQMNKEIEQNKPNIIENSGFQGGIDITELISGTDNKFDAVKPVNQSENTDFNNLKNPKDLSTSEVITFFNSLFESKPTFTDTSNSGLFEFERKVAAGQYGKYAKNIVLNASDFVNDALKLS